MTPAERADAWQLLLAVSHARRALWAPGLDLEQVLAQRWPSRQALGVVEVQHWLKHRLPHDTVFFQGAAAVHPPLPERAYNSGLPILRHEARHERDRFHQRTGSHGEVG